MTPNSYIDRLRSELDDALRALAFPMEPEGLYEPIRYTLELGGKRIRPILTLLACELFGGKRVDALPAAIAIEVFHNFTLLHDDIMDQTPLRRKQPTVHCKWDVNTAILSGDRMQILAYEHLTQTHAGDLLEILRVFNRTAAEVCEGQQFDMNFETSLEVSLDDYLEMIRLKTAVLLGASLHIGALIGGATSRQAEALYRFGVGMGMAFQLQDDFLDTYGDPQHFGKQIGGDIQANKKTFLLLSALQLAAPAQHKQLLEALALPSEEAVEKLRRVKALYDELELPRRCTEAIRYYYDEAQRILNDLEGNNRVKEELRNLAQNLLYRED